jgi:hypothetical protein
MHRYITCPSIVYIDGNYAIHADGRGIEVYKAYTSTGYVHITTGKSGILNHHLCTLRKGYTIMGTPKNPAVFYGAIVVAVLAILGAIYYALPGYSHILVTHDPLARHVTHTAAFVALAVICIVAALVTRPKAAAK